MARYYRSYGKRKRNTRIIYTLIILLVVIAAGFFYFKNKKENQPDQQNKNPERSVQQEPTASNNVSSNSNYSPGNSLQASDPMDKELQKQKQLLQERIEEEKKKKQALKKAENLTKANIELQDVPPEPTPDSDPKVAELMNQAMEHINAEPQRVIKARNILNQTLPLPMSKKQRKFIKSHLSVLADKWLFSRKIYPDDSLCDSYKVQPGDLLSKIGDKFNVPHQILMQINHLPNARSLQAGQNIKVLKGPFHARVDKSEFQLDLYLQNTYVRTFPVGLAKEQYDTPTGLWLVEPNNKLVRPTWTDPDTGKTYLAEDPNYPLGARWVGLEGLKGQAKGREGFALHGTKEEETIGTRSSRGCIRMHNQDIILIYSVLKQGVSKVEVVE